MRAFILAAAFVVGASSAWADQDRLCAPLGILEGMLLDEFGEKPVAHQFTEQGYMLTAYVDEMDGSWTIVAHDGTGGCVIQGGFADTLPPALLPFVDPQA